MLKNYLKIAVRALKNQKIYSFINITGLAVGIACFIMIVLWIKYEMSWDTSYERSENIYRVVEEQTYSDHSMPVEVTPGPLGPSLKENYPEIIDYVRIFRISDYVMNYGDKRYRVDGGAFADQSVIDILSLEFVHGDKSEALNDKASVIIDEELALKYFGDENPIGKVVTMQNKYDLTISGVYKKMPENSSFASNMFAPVELLDQFWRMNVMQHWGNNFLTTLIVVKENTDYKVLEGKIKNEIKRNMEGSVSTLHLQSVEDMHLYPIYETSGESGFVIYIYIFGSIAVFVLIIACINFINLATARAGKRAKEVGLRKVTGAFRTDIIKQHLGESFVISVIAVIIAVFLVEALLPLFRDVSEREIGFLFDGNFEVLWMLVTIAVVTAFFAGIYPAFYLSSFRPVTVLKEQSSLGRGKSLFRRVLVVFQFTLSITLIISTLIVSDQLDFIQSKDLGFSRDNIIYMNLSKESIDRYQTFKKQLDRKESIKNVSASRNLPTIIGSSTTGFGWPGKNPDEQLLFSFIVADYDFVETMNMEMADGRSFEKRYNDDTASVILNEAALELMELEEPLGKKVRWWKFELEIVGIVKDFHFRQLTSRIEPLFIVCGTDIELNYILVRTDGNNEQAIESIKETWASVFPNVPLKYNFLDEQYDRLYKSEIRMEKLFGYFTVLAIFISCLGLLGLAAYVAERQRKEIGIRKVLGASVHNLVAKMNMEFVILIAVSNIIAWPIAYYLMSSWLKEFAYRTEISLWLFGGAAIIALLVSIVTVSIQTVKAAYMNPVKAIKHE